VGSKPQDFEDVELRLDMNEEQGRRYEQACVQAVRQKLPSQLSQLRVLGREPLAVELEGTRPRTKLLVRYRDPNGNRRSFGFPLWDEGRLSTTAGYVAHPDALANVLVVNLSEPGEL
jgi:hypothetical protein